MKLLNVGGNSKSIPILTYYNGWEHHLLDIDPKGNPDICCDAVLLKDKKKYKGQYDSVYCSHNLEHFYYHKGTDVLAGFHMVLKQSGFVYIAVPHIMNVLRRVVAYNMDLEDKLYEVSAGIIRPLDVIYGWQRQIRESGSDFFAHKCGYTSKMLHQALINAQFPYVYILEADLELIGIAFKDRSDDSLVNKIVNRT
jgi:hypothetical protein